VNHFNSTREIKKEVVNHFYGTCTRYVNANCKWGWWVFCIEEDKIAIVNYDGQFLTCSNNGDVECGGDGDFSSDKTQIWTVEEVE